MFNDTLIILEKVHQLEYLTGRSLDKLVELFADGWYMSPPPPKQIYSLAELAVILNDFANASESIDKESEM